MVRETCSIPLAAMFKYCNVWLSLLHHILDIPDSHMYPQTGCTDRGFVWFSQILQEDGGVVTEIRQRCLVSHPFEFDVY